MINPTPLATVFMPCYNAGAYLLDAVASVLAQTESNWELLVVDDGSNDGSIQAMQARFDDPRIRVHRLAQNMGTGVARNQGLDLARGQFLINLDADDLALPQRIAKQTRFFLDHPDVDVLTGAMEIFDAHTIHGHTRPPESNAELQAMLLSCGNNIANPASALRMSFVHLNQPRFDPVLRVAQDLDFWIQCALNGAQFASHAGVVTRYRLHPSQAVKNIAALSSGQASALTRLLQGWFPTLSASAISALATLMTPSPAVRMGPTQLQEAFNAAGFVLQQQRTAVGTPNMVRVHELVNQHVQRWTQAISR